MSSRRPRPRRIDPGPDLRLAMTAMATTVTSTLAWRGFTDNPDRFLVPLVVIGVLIAGTGTLGRTAGLSGWLVVPVQVVVAATGALVSIAGTLLPTPDALARVEAVLGAAAESSTRYAAPVAGDVPPIEPLLLLAALGCLLVVDLLACTLRRVPLAGLPLLTVYTLPVSMLGGQVSWWVFALPAAGFVWMLYQHTEVELDRWDGAEDRPPPGARTDDGLGVRAGGVRGTALGIGAAATGLAVLLPLVVPTLSLAVFDGPGAGDGSDEISLENPMADLRRDLRRPDDTVLLRARTTDPDPSYLRISVLNRFADEAWTSGDRNLPDGQVAQGAQPTPQGVTETVPRRTEDWQIDVTEEFSSTWLPTPYPLAAVDAEGLWKYDDGTRDFIAAEADLTTAGLSYEATGLELELTAEELALSSASSSAVGAEYTEVPDDQSLLDVRQLARTVTDGAANDFSRAVALQDWFRREGGFTYSLEPDDGNGTDALVAFLSDGPSGRTGYCEQFAAAMAVMARTLDIPARVAVGFLQPDRVGSGSDAVWEYSSNDLHAWPELYFPGAGWVRFEPTPPGRASQVPDYTQGVTAPGEVPEADPGAGSELTPELGDEQAPDGQGGTNAARASGSVEMGEGIAWGAVGLVLGLPVAMLLLVGAPALARTARTARRRQVSSPVEAAWAELADVVVDHGGVWPPGRSPREVGVALRPRVVSASGSADSLAGPALDRVVAAVELSRYARTAPDPDDHGLRFDVEEVRRALSTASSRRGRLLARWLPRSLVRRPVTRLRPSRTSSAPRPGTVVDRLV